MSETQTPPGTWSGPHIVGTDGNDTLYGSKSASRFDGGAGDDLLYGNFNYNNAGNTSYFDGGDGVDTLVLGGSGFAGVQVTFDSATGTYKLGDITLKNIEYINFGDVQLKVEDSIHIEGTQHRSTNGDDQLVGNDFGYVLNGGEGNDTLTGNGGDDTLYGGKGEDTAVFRGNRADYDIRFDYNTWQYTVTDHQPGRDGKDVVLSTEQLRFADTTIPLHNLADSTPDAATIAKLDGVVERVPPPPLPFVSIDGGAGDDTISPWAPIGIVNSIDGGAGVDTVFLGAGFAGTRVDFDADTGTYKAGSLTLKNVEFIDFGDIKLKVEDAVNRAGTQHQYTDGDDQLISNDFGYALNGGNGNDTFTGNGGDDTLYGGKGEDTAVFRGNRADYDIRFDYNTYQYIVTDHQTGRDGKDKLGSIEQLKFTDTTIPLHGTSDSDNAPDAATLARLDGVIEALPPPPPQEYDGDLTLVIGTWDWGTSWIAPIDGGVFELVALPTTASAAISASFAANGELDPGVVLTGMAALEAIAPSGFALDTP